MASTYLSRTFGSAGNQKTWTWSAWIKRSKLSTNQVMFANYTSGSIRQYISFNTNNQLFMYGQVSGTDKVQCNTTRVFRDTNAWYHIVVAQDTTQGTGSNRMKLYVNGVQETLSFTTTPSQNDDISINDNGLHLIGAEDNAGNSTFDGSMSHVHFIDGTALAPTAFGETDTTTGEWEAKTSPSVTYGTNGFLILKDGNTITDQSSNSNDWTLGSGTLTDLKDNPDNTFATLNPLDNYYTAATFSNGNTSQTTHAGNYGWSPSTLGMTSGKFYAEMKQTGFSGSSNYNIVGITSRQLTASNIYLGQSSEDWGYYAQGNGVYNGGSFLTTYASWTTNDIIGIALDLDNNKLYFSKNGTWQNSGVPTSGSTGTGAISVTANKTYFFASGDYGTSLVCNNSWNFGNGYFGTTAVSSAGTNASNNGIFEYDVPTGYTALSTKGLNL
jgi:hypothetical protein